METIKRRIELKEQLIKITRDEIKALKKELKSKSNDKHDPIR